MFQFSRFKFHSQKGFTMIEMIVVISIVAILPTIIIANFPEVKLQFALSRAAYKFGQDVRRAQDMALSSAKYKDAQGNMQDVAGYGVHATTMGNYVIYADAAPGNREYDALDYIVDTIDLTKSEPGIVIKEINNVFGNSVMINFNPPDPTTTITDLLSGEHSIDVVFAQERSLNKTKTVSVNTSGLIEVK